MSQITPMARKTMMPDSAVTTHKVTPPSLQGTTAGDASPRSQVVLLQSLVSIVLGYQILFSPEAHLVRAVQEVLVLGLLLLVAGAMVLPVRVVESRGFTIVLLLIDTTVASTVFYLSGDVGPDLYLAFFLIILISASTRTLNQKIGFSVLVTLGYGGILYLGVGQTRLLLEGHLLRIPILLVMGLFYGLMNETLQGERQEKAALIEYIAERKRMEEQLHQSNKLAALGTLLDGVAHELNNPLFMISGYTQLAGEKVKQERYAGLSEDLASIREAAQRASAIVERTMAVMRQAKEGREPCEVTAFVQRTLEQVSDDLTRHQIEAHTHFRPDLPRVLADRQDLPQVFLNLFTNAGQAMAAAHGRGTLTVTTAFVEPWVEIRVTDDGPGIAPEHLSRIFDPFFTTQPVGQGMGLGLPIALRIVTDLRGTLTCESVLGHGATFIVRLPALSEVRQ